MEDSYRITRRVGEELNLGNGIILKILETRGPVVRFGIIAPKDVPVHRKEVHERIQREPHPEDDGGLQTSS